MTNENIGLIILGIFCILVLAYLLWPKKQDEEIETFEEFGNWPTLHEKEDLVKAAENDEAVSGDVLVSEEAYYAAPVLKEEKEDDAEYEAVMASNSSFEEYDLTDLVSDGSLEEAVVVETVSPKRNKLLSPPVVREIRYSRKKYAELAYEHNVSVDTIRSIKNDDIYTADRYYNN